MSYGGYNDGRRSSGQLVRFGIAAVIAIVGFISYMSKTQINPVTGEKQRVSMNVDQEKRMGLEAAPQMAAKMGGALDPRSDVRARAVAEVGRLLVDKSDASKSPYVGNFHFTLLDDPKTVNAFALPGGPIFITVALYERMTDEAELAGVLGHEIGHVINRHAAQHMAKSELGQMLTVAVGVGSSGNDDGGRKAQMAAMMANQMMQLKYGRGDESQSDEFGMRFMAEAGYDPTAMLDVMKILKDSSKGGGPPEMLSTHPLPETRLQEIAARLKKDYPDGIPRSLTRGRKLPH